MKTPIDQLIYSHHESLVLIHKQVREGEALIKSLKIQEHEIKQQLSELQKIKAFHDLSNEN